MEAKTHKEVKQPTMSVQQLADYMAASERTKRTIVKSCKFRAIARLLQHNEAKRTISKHICDPNSSSEKLKEKSDFIRSKLYDSDFEQLTNESNAEYVLRFSNICELISLPSAEYELGSSYKPFWINGVNITFAPNVVLRRTTRTNKLRHGALMLRYAKGRTLDSDVAAYQSAAIFGLLQMLPEEGSEAEKMLCLTLDAHSGAVHAAPGASSSIWENMKAACQTIAEGWPNIAPPPNMRL